MPNLDIRTISFLAMFTSVLLAIGLQIVNRIIVKDASLRLWAIGATANAGAYVLFALRNLVPDLLSIVLANTLLVAGAACWHLGNRRFTGRGAALRWPWFVAAVAGAVMFFFTYVAPSLSARIVALSAAVAAVLLAAALALLESGERSNRMARWFIGAPMLATALFMAARALVTLVSDTPGQNFMMLTNPIHTSALIFGIALNLVLGIGLPLLVSERMQRRLIESEQRYRTLYTRTPAIMHSIDNEGKIVGVSDLWSETLAYPREKIIGRKSTDFLTEESRRFAAEHVLPDFFRTGSCTDIPYQFVTGDGRILDMLLSAILERDAEDRPLRSLAVLTDVTARKQSQQYLEHLMAEQQAMLENDLIGIVKTCDRIILWANPAFEKMLGYGPGELVGTPTAQHYPTPEAHAAFGAAAYPALADSKVYRSQIQHKRKDGALIWVDVSGTTFDRESGESLWCFLDITELKASEAKIHSLAFYDALTHLPNRRMLMDRLAVALPKSGRHDSHGAILFLDLDGFKQLNDTRGHEYGDLLLLEVAQRLLVCVRAVDTVARLGGDEFVVMVEDLSQQCAAAAHQAEAIGEKVRDAVAAEYTLRGEAYRCTASIGISLFKGADTKVSELIKRADIAMYQAKSAGRNAVRRFNAEFSA